MLLLFLFLLVIWGWTHLASLSLYARLRCKPRSWQRKAAARWQVFWARLGHFLCRTVGGMRIVYDGPHPSELPKGSGPYIVIGNHFGVFEGILITLLLAEAGTGDFRPVSKISVSKMPILGRAWKMLGAAFVVRDHRPEDIQAVATMAQQAEEDGANVLIFPEGTVYHRDKLGDGYRHVLPPRHGGFRRMVGLLPERSVLCVTMRWHDFDPYWLLAGEGVVPPGSGVSMSWRVLPPPGREDPGAYLDRVWRQVDDALDAAGGHGRS